MPAVRIKTEEIENPTLNGDHASGWNPSHPRPQHALDHNDRIRAHASPYRAPGPVSHHQVPSIQPHPAAIAQAIAQANQETLLETRNAVYLCALQEIHELRAIAAGYQRQVISLNKDLCNAQNAYTQLLAQIKAPQCQTDLQVQGKFTEEPEVPETSSSSPLLALPESELSVTTLCGTAVLPRVHEFYGPVPLPEGFRVIPHVGHWITTPDIRPSAIPFEVFWNKADWFGKGYANGTFVTDRNGKWLMHLLKGIRKTARRIWTELERRPGAFVASTFKKNEFSFMSDYISTIEAIYPCLKLCSSHWKAEQIGISAYSHWYKNRNKYFR